MFFPLQHNVLALQQQMEELQTACVKLNEVHTMRILEFSGATKCQMSLLVPLLDYPKCNHVNIFGFFNLCVCVVFVVSRSTTSVWSQLEAEGKRWMN